MIYVSLPVHTRPAVIAGQLANFAAFLPGAKVVLHLSANARFTLAQLEDALDARDCGNAILNPQRLSTGWGNILAAHLANAAWIRRNAPGCTRICLHASNDMLVRAGLVRHLGRGGNFLHHRPILPGSRWRFAHAALSDMTLHAVRKRLGEVPIVGSQVEGSSYEPALLFEIADIIKHAVRQPTLLSYPREEVWLSTVAHARAASVVGTPYVFSEVHRFDRAFWRVLRFVDPLLGRPGDARWLPRRALEFIMIRSGFHRIDQAWVERIAADRADELAPYESLSDGNSKWRVFERHGLFGVKRVPRRVEAPLRRYIDQLGEQLREQLRAQDRDQAIEQPNARLDAQPDSHLSAHLSAHLTDQLSEQSAQSSTQAGKHAHDAVETGPPPGAPAQAPPSNTASVPVPKRPRAHPPHENR